MAATAVAPKLDKVFFARIDTRHTPFQPQARGVQPPDERAVAAANALRQMAFLDGAQQVRLVKYLDAPIKDNYRNVIGEIKGHSSCDLHEQLGEIASLGYPGKMPYIREPDIGH